jgi:hypothetical protein
MTAGKNAVINGGFDIWQRGTSFTAASSYTADRWYAGSSTARTLSRQVTNDTTNLPFIQYCARMQRNSGSTSTTIQDFGSPVETNNVVPYAGKAITFSYYARAGANYSAASSLLTVSLYTGTGTDQNAFAGYTGVAQPISTTSVLTTTWQRFQHTITLGSTVTEFMPYFAYTPVGTAGANDYFEVTGVQVEVGSIATQFSRAGATIQGELAACQRYYYRNSSIDSNTVFGSGWGWTGTQATLILNTKVTMRTKPSALDYSSINLQAVPAGTTYAITSWTLDTGLLGADTIATIPVVASGLTASLNYRLIGASGSAYVGLSAEL